MQVEDLVVNIIIILPLYLHFHPPHTNLVFPSKQFLSQTSRLCRCVIIGRTSPWLEGPDKVLGQEIRIRTVISQTFYWRHSISHFSLYTFTTFIKQTVISPGLGFILKDF